MNRKNNKKFFIVIGLFLFLITGSILWVKARSKNTSPSAKGEITIKVDKAFDFIGRDQNGNPTLNDLSLAFTTASKKDSVTIQGQKATAKDGKIFLVLEVQIKNDSQQVLYLLPVDLIRLVMDEGTKVAPSVHQGMVEVRPVSTKFSNLGFVVEVSQKEFKFEIGEVDEEKQEMMVRF